MLQFCASSGGRTPAGTNYHRHIARMRLFHIALSTTFPPVPSSSCRNAPKLPSRTTMIEQYFCHATPSEESRNFLKKSSCIARPSLIGPANLNACFILLLACTPNWMSVIQAGNWWKFSFKTCTIRRTICLKIFRHRYPSHFAYIDRDRINILLFACRCLFFAEHLNSRFSVSLTRGKQDQAQIPRSFMISEFVAPGWPGAVLHFWRISQFWSKSVTKVSLPVYFLWCCILTYQVK